VTHQTEPFQNASGARVLEPLKKGCPVVFSTWVSEADRAVFPSSNRWGIPDLEAQAFGRAVLRLPLLPYRSRERHGICHFFLWDEKFETVWRRPYASLPAVASYKAVLTRDFSLCRDAPLTVQLWNTYCNRWMGAFWQHQGLRVIPTIGWSTARTFRFAFCGVPPGQILAIGTPDLRDRIAKRPFVRGLKVMCERLAPAGLIVFGVPPGSLPLGELIPKTCVSILVPHRFQRLRGQRRRWLRSRSGPR
jgi:hypothetical protein